ncbi:hypothetical protein ISN44_As01g038050 [Arabidopsis suecica]|uniref:Transmembrane protein n=2 Tax=Arabidopsis TaxID=3701 RepID=A0A5S9WPJ9_ARATH|nr:hypothetical protein ISN44_As01g038050 [Arabidopsis suecica]CAA0275469.1 unnamed protein product [Arabidopsis thaliana]
METKLMILLCIIFLVEVFSILGGVDCRALRTEQTTGCDQTTATVESGGFGVFSGAANGSRDHLLMRSLAFRLASGPSRKGRGH